MGYLIAIMVVWIIAVAVAIVIRRRSRAAANTAAAVTQTPDRPATAPMNDLESALAKVTDRDGKPIRDRIDAETQHVDDLRVPDDTGPLLRRALDHVQPGDAPGDAPPPSGDDAATPPDAT